MSSWLLSVVGVIFIGVLFDLIYPNGKTNQLCKSIFGLISLFVIVAPILRIDINKYINSSSISVNLEDEMLNARNKTLQLKVIDHLSRCNINGINVVIESFIEDDDYIIENIFVETTDLVLTENITNINKYEVIANEIANVVDIEPERIIVYG